MTSSGSSHPPGPLPTRVRVRMYQVGFGDCFLLSFEYPAALEDGRSARHMLIDFGSTKRPPSGQSTKDVAELIEEHSGGRLDVIAVSHRHQDHLSGFAADAAAAIVDRLHPGLVIRSWTEDPDAPADSGGQSSLDEGSRDFVVGLRSGQILAKALKERIPEEERGLLGGLRGLAAAEMSNQEAVGRLNGWADGKGRYLRYGDRSGIEEVIPGVTVRVLGPPTLADAPEIARQRAEDPEFWMLYSRMIDQAAFEDLMAATRAAETENDEPSVLGPERWLIQRMRRQRLGSLLRIVRILDDVLNNTSLILLIQAGKKRMLFPGDAQIENWNWALKGAPDHEENIELLRAVDLYKVGHHGSRNATPRTLFGLWTEDGTRDRPMSSLMSTLSGVHGESAATRVPRATLISALRERMPLFSTEELSNGNLFVEIEADTSSDEAFRLVPGVHEPP